jgi:flagellar hook-basal body complex protein FliE
MQPIAGLSAGVLQASPLSTAVGGAPASAGATSFKDMLMESIGHVNQMQQDADHAVEQLLAGGDVNAAEVLTTLQKADMSFRLMLQIRNKLTEAFQQVQAIQI